MTSGKVHGGICHVTRLKNILCASLCCAVADMSGQRRVSALSLSAVSSVSAVSEIKEISFQKGGGAPVHLESLCKASSAVGEFSVPGGIQVRACPYTDVRLKDGFEDGKDKKGGFQETLLKESMSSTVSQSTFGAPDANVSTVPVGGTLTPVLGSIAPAPDVTYVAPAPVLNSIDQAPVLTYVAPAPGAAVWMTTSSFNKMLKWSECMDSSFPGSSEERFEKADKEEGIMVGSVPETTGTNDVSASFDAYITSLKGDWDNGGGGKDEEVAEAIFKKDVPATFDAYIASIKGDGNNGGGGEVEESAKATYEKKAPVLFEGMFSRPAAYHVTQRHNPWPTLCLELLVPATAPLPPFAATEGPGDSGVNPLGDRPSPWARWRPGVASVEKLEVGPKKEKVIEKVRQKKEAEVEEDLWETVFLEEPNVFEWVKEKVVKEGEKEKQKEVERMSLDQEKTQSPMAEKVEKEVNEEEAKVKEVKVRKGLLSPSEVARVRAGELERALVPLLFPGRLKRKFVSYKTCPGIRVISRANGDRVKQEERKKEMKRKEMEKEKLKQKEKVNLAEAAKLFTFGAGEKEEPFVFGGSVREPVSYYKKAEEGSEVFFLGRPVVQVREELTSPEPGKICFMHRLQGGLQVASVLGGQSLGDWARQLLGERVWEGMGGYFTTKGGKVLNSETPVNKLGLHGSQEVVLQGRLRGGGYSGGGKGARGGGGNSEVAGDWTCWNCEQPGCWNARTSCYRCGAPRYRDQGGAGQGSSGGRDMEGRYQSGVGTGMGGYRVIGPNGRDQSYIPGGNPTQRKGPQPRGKGRNKVGGDTGAGVGVGFGTGGGVVGGGGGGDNRSAFSWLGGGGGVGNPLPPGIVPSERDQAQFCLEHLKGLLKDERDVEEFSNFWEGRLPAKPEPAPVKTPTEAQRAEVFAQLTKRQDGLMKRVKEGQVRVDAAKAKVRQEEAVVEELERELKVVSDQVDAHRAENLRRAEEAKAPRVQEVGSDMDLEAACSSGGEFGVNLVTGKRRKVVRKNRFQGNKPTREELLQFFNGMSNPDRDWFKMQLKKMMVQG